MTNINEITNKLKEKTKQILENRNSLNTNKIWCVIIASLFFGNIGDEK